LRGLSTDLLDEEALARALSISAGRPLLVAVSGGGDSMALLHLLRERLGAEKLIAVIVDHKLRPGSDADARRARDMAQALGVRAEIATLDWAGPPRRAQAHARQARHRALCDAARRLGARVIALAHSGDDQAETLLMRAAAGSNWRGLAGIAAFTAAPVWPQGRGLHYVRPLLGARRQALRAELKARGGDWIDDPANANRAFARVRVRARLAELEAAGFEPARLMALAARLRVLSAELDVAAAALIARTASFEADAILLDPGHWDDDPETRRRALSVLVAAASGREREPSGPGLARLEARLGGPDFRGACLAGTRLAPFRDGRRLDRDPGALAGRADGVAAIAPLDLPPGVETVWDGRLALTAPEPGWSVRAGGAGVRLERAGEIVALQAFPGRAEWLLSQRQAHLLNQAG
jgi:tRNA(Ile)-lysidine synthase